MVGVLGPNPSVDTQKEAIQKGCLFLLETLQPAFELEDHLVVVGEAFAITPAVTARRIDMY